MSVFEDNPIETYLAGRVYLYEQEGVETKQAQVYAFEDLLKLHREVSRMLDNVPVECPNTKDVSFNEKVATTQLQPSISILEPFTLYIANCVSNVQNTVYPKEIFVRTPEDLLEAVKHDHVGAKYKDNQRKNNNFEWANVIMMDVDNETDEPQDWITLEKLNEFFAGYGYAVTSRNHMKTKDGKSPRPKFHVYFPILKLGNANEYAKAKAEIVKQYPFFDRNARDAARFFFGNPEAQVFVLGGGNVNT